MDVTKNGLYRKYHPMILNFYLNDYNMRYIELFLDNF